MSNLVQATPSLLPPPQSISENIAPGIIGLFVQGLESGIVLMQLSRWFYLGRTESIGVKALVLFVTTVGLVETGVSFASAWRIYVLDYGKFIFPGWTDLIHVLLSSLQAVPIQAFFIWNCYHILHRNICLIIPLILALISSLIVSIYFTLQILHIGIAKQPNQHDKIPVTISYSFVACLVIPAALDITITCILFYSLMKFLRRIHAEHLRRRVTRYMIVIWQSAIPPCFCAVALLVKYIVFTELHPNKRTMWYGTIQAMLGKLYILSLYYTLNNRMDLDHEPPTTYLTTMNEIISNPARGYVFSRQFPDPEQQCK
ncbi:hypothetical protein BGW80DRAFT_871766 [Lactifluus volemus]|nr:hypothetical protein BGW80DRAFT_871766 [Lactifluus volemus]